MSCATTTSLGAYVLGALDEQERDRVDVHLADCAECRAELESLMPLGSYLVRLSTDDVLALEPEPARPPAEDAWAARRAAAVATRRRERTRRGLAALLTLAAVAAALTLAWPAGSESPARAAAADPNTGVRAAVAAAPRPWGTGLTVRLSGAAPGERCRLVARARDGRTEIAATWQATYRGTAEVTGATAIPAAELVAVDVVAAAGPRLVHVPMNHAGGT
jgi:putative zinc finger protein